MPGTGNAIKRTLRIAAKDLIAIDEEVITVADLAYHSGPFLLPAELVIQREADDFDRAS